MTDETGELHRIIKASVRDMLDAYRIQAQAGPLARRPLRSQEMKRILPGTIDQVSFAQKGPIAFTAPLGGLELVIN